MIESIYGWEPMGLQILCLAEISSGRLIAAMIFAGMFGIPFAGIALYFRPKYKKAKKIHQLMLNTETTPIGSIKPGPVEIRGRVSSSMPPAPSPWTQKPCVFYHFNVQQQKYSSHNDITRTVWVDYINDRRSVPFEVEDETGSVDIISGEGEFQINADHFTKSGKFNDAPEDLRAMLNTRYGKDTQGLMFNKELRYYESILENGDEIYVFGEVKQKDGKLVIGAGGIEQSRDSHRSSHALLKQLRRDANLPLIISENSQAGGEANYAARVLKYKLYYYGMLIFGLVFSVGVFLLGLFAVP